MKAVLAAVNSKYIHTGLGLRYVGEYARGLGHEIVLIEETINTPLLAVLEKLMGQDAPVYGFSLHIWNKPFVFRLISMLKKLRPDAVAVVGGPEAAFDADRIFGELPAIDYIVQGEGEIVFSRLLDYLEKGGEVPEHIAFRKDGKTELNGGVTVINDLSVLPFPYPDLEEVIAGNRIVYYECTRGCPFNCSYCLSGISRTVRRRPLELVLKDLDRFIAAGAKLVKFVDRTYNLDENYFLPVMEHLAAAECDATFHFEIKADMLSEKALAFLQTVPPGRFQMEIGIQTTHKPALEAINRKDDWQKLSANCRRLLGFGNMHIHVDLIAGLPYEGLAEFARSFDGVYGLGADMLQLGFLKVLPGTQMRREAQRHGLIYMDEPPYEILATEYMPYKDMQLLKQIENIFDQTANTGAFKSTLARLIEYCGGGAFDFFRRLTGWWVQAGHYPQNHNLKGTAAILHQYINESGCFDENRRAVLTEALRYDVFAALPGWQPAWLSWNTELIYGRVSAFWRDEERVRRYIPGYKFSSWRQIHKNYPIEMFARDPLTGAEGETYLMADCSGEKTKIIRLEF